MLGSAPKVSKHHTKIWMKKSQTRIACRRVRRLMHDRLSKHSLHRGLPYAQNRASLAPLWPIQSALKPHRFVMNTIPSLEGWGSAVRAASMAGNAPRRRPDSPPITAPCEINSTLKTS